MQTLELSNYDTSELNSTELINVDGGYGYHAGHQEFSDFWAKQLSSFAGGFVDGLEKALKSCNC